MASSIIRKEKAPLPNSQITGTPVGAFQTWATFLPPTVGTIEKVLGLWASWSETRTLCSPY